MSQLRDLRNIGATLAKRLEEIEIFSKTDLKAVGSAMAYRQLQANYPGSHLPLCYYLYSLEGALQDRDWRSFTDKEKAEMQRKAGI